MLCGSLAIKTKLSVGNRQVLPHTCPLREAVRRESVLVHCSLFTSHPECILPPTTCVAYVTAAIIWVAALARKTSVMDGISASHSIYHGQVPECTKYTDKI